MTTRRNRIIATSIAACLGLGGLSAGSVGCSEGGGASEGGAEAGTEEDSEAGSGENGEAGGDIDHGEGAQDAEQGDTEELDTSEGDASGHEGGTDTAEPDAATPDIGPGPDADPPKPTGPLKVTTVASGLENPWGLAFLSGGRMLVTERPGRMRIVQADGTLGAPLKGLPGNLVTGGQGGLLDVVVDPGFEGGTRIFFSYSESGAGGRGTAVARAILDESAGALTDVSVVFSQTPKVSGTGHFGGRLTFDADGQYLFVTTGDRQQGGQPQQDLSSGLGKVFRITRTGAAAPGNPYAATAGAEKLWSIGHRNIQGTAIHPISGELWTHEHGPQGGDEVNITEAGKNYGWPLVSYGCPYGSNPCNPIGGGTHAPTYEEPLAWWPNPSTAPSGMAFYEGNNISEWDGKLLVGALAGRTLWVLDITQSEPPRCAPANDRRHCDEVPVAKALNERFRDVRVGPDGWVYLLTDNSEGRILRIER